MPYQFLFLVSFVIFLKTVHQYHQVSLIEKAENPKYITSLLNPYFVKSFSILNVFQVSLWNKLNVFNQLNCPDYFVPYFNTLFFKEVLKVFFVKNNGSKLLIFRHDQKIGEVALKCNMLEKQNFVFYHWPCSCN